ncbi:MAG: hypothetical protein Kow0031_19560 [Anaerolineae bacterium]
MRYAIFSDIHDNLTALQQVLAHISTQAVDACFCLGDIGDDACVSLLRDREMPTVFGNGEAYSWRELHPENRQWVLGLPPMIREPEFWLTHAGPFWPHKIRSLNDFVNNGLGRARHKPFPYLHYEEDSLWATIAALTEADVTLMFHGHTHRQLAWRFMRSNKLQRSYNPLLHLKPGETYVVGVGSVGSPNDGPGACYAIFDSAAQTVELIRLV